MPTLTVTRAEWRPGMNHGVLFGRVNGAATYALLDSYAVRHYQEMLQQGITVELDLPANRLSRLETHPAGDGREVRARVLKARGGS